MAIGDRLDAEQQDQVTAASLQRQEAERAEQPYRRNVRRARAERPDDGTLPPEHYTPNHAAMPTRPITPRTRVPMDPIAAGALSADQAVRPGAPPPPQLQRRDPNRKPFGMMEQRMARPEMPGFRQYWFNDTTGRIDRALAAGYEHVKDTEGRPVSMIVGKSEMGELRAFLMRIPLEWYEEDQAALQAQQDAVLSGIKAGRHQGSENSYIPDRGITITSRRG